MSMDEFDLEVVQHTDHEIVNTIPDELIPYAQRLFAEVLVPWQILVGPVHINSWFRSPELNKLVKGEAKSAHLEARAADCVPRGNIEAALKMLIASDIPFDKAIYETHKSSWIHVQINEDPSIARRQVLRGLQEGDRMVYTAYNA